MLLGVTVRDLVAADVGADQRVERAGAVAEGHRRAVPERVLVVVAVVHAHHQLERQRVRTGVGVVHVLDHAAEVMGVVQRRVAAVDAVAGMARAGIGERGRAGGAVVEVDRLDLGVVHRAGAARNRDVHEAVVGAVFVLAGLGVASGAGTDQVGGQAFPLLQHLAAVRIDDHERTRRVALRGRIREEVHHVRLVRVPGVVDVDHQPDFSLRVTIAPSWLPSAACLAIASAWPLNTREGAVEISEASPVTWRPNSVRSLPPLRVLADHDALAEHRNAAEGLLVAGVGHP